MAGNDAIGRGVSGSCPCGHSRMTPLLLTRTEAAALLSISPDQLDRWERAGKLRAVREGKLVRYSPAALAEDVATMVPTRGAAASPDIRRTYSDPAREWDIRPGRVNPRALAREKRAASTS